MTAVLVTSAGTVKNVKVGIRIKLSEHQLVVTGRSVLEY